MSAFRPLTTTARVHTRNARLRNVGDPQGGDVAQGHRLGLVVRRGLLLRRPGGLWRRRCGPGAAVCVRRVVLASVQSMRGCQHARSEAFARCLPFSFG